MKVSLGINVFEYDVFYSIIRRLHPIVKKMLDEMCEEAKQEMKKLDDKTLGSWKRAVTSADGTWMTRGYFSKNGTFSIRNYLNGALLFYKHLCQKGKDDVIDEDLYKGTSKSMEGFAAREILMQAKKEGMEIAVQW